MNTNENEVNKIREELLKMCFDDERTGVDRSPFLETNRKRVRELGERLNEIGGFPLMLLVCESILLNDQRELECAWNSIGEWLS